MEILIRFPHSFPFLPTATKPFLNLTFNPLTMQKHKEPYHIDSDLDRKSLGTRSIAN